MIYFTADTHFNHEAVIRYSNRPFSDLEEMHERLIESWNELVKPGDTIYHLGDFALSWGKKSDELIDAVLSRLNGQKWLITGNHDREEVVNNRQWVKVLPYHELKVDRGGEHKQRIVLSHYSMRSWNQSHRGSWMLHGHSHGNLSDIGGKSCDVGVDSWNYRPVSIDVMECYMSQRDIRAVDHHVTEEQDE